MIEIKSFFLLYLADSFVFKLCVASLLGALIGFERAVHGRSAGLRTNLLVTLGSAAFMILSETIAAKYMADPNRLAAQVITGIGFIGAGAIIKSGVSIHGLTTAACLWIAAAIGMSIGSGYYLIGVSIAVISLFSTVVLNKVSKIYAKDFYRFLEIKTSISVETAYLSDLLEETGVTVLYFDIEKDYQAGTLDVVFALKIRDKIKIDSISKQMFNALENRSFDLHKLIWRQK